MTRFSHYRTLALAVALALALPGCEAITKKNPQVEQRQKWDLTRVGVLYQLALQQYQTGDYDKARQTLGQIFATATPHAPSHILIAKVDLEKGSLEEAAAHLKTAIQIDANDAEAYYLLGVTYQRWQNMQTAGDYYELAWQKKPNEALYLLAVVEMKISLGQYDQAQTLLNDKMVYFEQSSAVRAALAKICVLKGDYEQASHYYRDATLLSPDDAGLRLNYAEALFFTQRYNDVIPILEDLRKNDAILDKHSVLTLLGQSYLSAHRTREARTVFADQTRENPNDNIAWLNLGKATMILEDYSQASSVARRVLKLEPENAQALLLLGLSLEKLGQWDQAQTILTQDIKIDPKNSTVLCMLGLIAQHRGQSEQAEELFHQAVSINPSSIWAQELLASAKPAAPVPPAAPAIDATPAPAKRSEAAPVLTPTAQSKAQEIAPTNIQEDAQANAETAIDETAPDQSTATASDLDSEQKTAGEGQP